MIACNTRQKEDGEREKRYFELCCTLCFLQKSVLHCFSKIFKALLYYKKENGRKKRSVRNQRGLKAMVSMV